MDIPALSIALSQSKVINEISTAVLSMNLDNIRSEENAVTELLTPPARVMEQSVQPYLGQNIDISL